MTGGFLSEAEVARVADLMARDMLREPIFYRGSAPLRIALVKVENDTTQYLFSAARDTYIERMRAKLQTTLEDRVKFVDPKAEARLRSELAGWHIQESQTAALVRGSRERHGVDYLLTARFLSQDKDAHWTDKHKKPKSRRIVVLQMDFSLVDAETAEIAWMGSVFTAAAFSTRDFQF